MGASLSRIATRLEAAVLRLHPSRRPAPEPPGRHVRDYAEIGWQVHREGQRTSQATGGLLTRAWNGLSGPGATTVLLVVVAGVALLESRSGGPVLPVADPTRLGALGLRVTLVLLGLNLVAAAMRFVLPSLFSRLAAPGELEMDAAVSARQPLPTSDDDPDLSRALFDSGLSTARRRGLRRAWGGRGLLALLGLATCAVGVLALGASFALRAQSSAPGTVVLTEGESTESIDYQRGAREPLDVYLGYEFTLGQTAGLIDGLDSGSGGNANLRVKGVTGSEDMLSLEPDSAIGLRDGTWLRLSSVRPLARPTKARLRILPPEGADVREVDAHLGRSLSVGNQSFTVVDITRGEGSPNGAAVQLQSSGAPFWIFADAPELSLDWPGIAGHRVEVLDIIDEYAVVIERFEPSNGTLPLAGLALLLVGGCLLLVTTHLRVVVDDEIDRVVVRGSSINHAAAVDQVVHAVAERVVREVASSADDIEEDAV